MDCFTDEDGLSNNLIRDIHQDKIGYLWIATSDGLNRYDGYNFKTFRNNRTDSNSICGNQISSIFEDSNGDLWFGTYNGFCKFDLSTEQFTNYQGVLNDTLSLNNYKINSISEDKFGNIWLATSKGLYNFNPATNKYTEFLPDSANASCIHFDRVRTLFNDKDGDIWIGSFGCGVSYYDSDNNRFINFNSEDYPFLKNKTITSFYDDGAGNIYVSAMLEVSFKIDKKSMNLVDLSDTDIINSVYGYFYESPDKKVYVINDRNIGIFEPGQMKRTDFIDEEYKYPKSFGFQAATKTKEGVIWVGSNGYGLYKFTPKNKQFNTIKYDINKKNRLTINSMRAIFLDSDGNLWLGGYTKLNVIYNFKELAQNTKPGKLDIIEIEKFNGKNVFSIIEDPKDKDILWIGTEFNGLFQYNKKKLVVERLDKKPGFEEHIEGNIFSMFIKDKYNNLWMATNKELLKINTITNQVKRYSYNKDNLNSIDKGEIFVLHEDSNGFIWIGTFTSGISILNPMTDEITRLKNNINVENSLSNNLVISIHEDKKNNVWIGTKSGLNKYSPDSKTFEIYTVDNDLVNDCINAIFEDEFGNIWLSCNKGLSKLNPETKTIQNFDVSYGLQSNSFNSIAYFSDDTGRLYFGGINGITYFNPAKIQDNNHIPNVAITNFQKFNKNVQLDKSLSFTDQLDLSYKDYVFSFEFTAFDFTFPGKNKYAYIMEGFEPEWNYTNADKRFATYTNLDAGEYTFKVKATNNDGIWNETGKSLKVVIAHPYWETWWFRLFTSSVLLGIVFQLYRSRVNWLKREKTMQQKLTEKLIEKQEEERERIAGELHDSIGQDLLIAKNKLFLIPNKNSKDRVFDDISDSLSVAIDGISRISHNLHPLELEELGFTMTLSAMVERVSNSTLIKFKLNSDDIDDIDELINEKKQINLFRIIQEAVNNIIKHSLATTANISIVNDNTQIVIKITDDGVGFDVNDFGIDSQRPHFGLSGMKERVKLLDGKLNISSKPNEGTEIILLINKL